MTTNRSIVEYKDMSDKKLKYTKRLVFEVTPLKDRVCFNVIACHKVLKIRGSDIRGFLVVLLFFADSLRNVTESRNSTNIWTGVAVKGMMVGTCPIEYAMSMNEVIEQIMSKTGGILSLNLREKSKKVPMRNVFIINTSDANELERQGMNAHLFAENGYEYSVEKRFVNCIWSITHSSM